MTKTKRPRGYYVKDYCEGCGEWRNTVRLSLNNKYLCATCRKREAGR